MAEKLATQTFNFPSMGSSTFELWNIKGNALNGKFCIEWTFKNSDKIEQIGILAKNGRVVDYDGIETFPKQAKTFLRNNHFIVPNDII